MTDRGTQSGFARWLLFLLLALAAAIGAGVFMVQRMMPAAAAPAELDPAHAQLADRFLDHLDAGEFEAAWAMFGPQMREALPQAQLEKTWRSLPDQLGERKARGAPRGETLEGEPITTVVLDYGLMALDARLHFDAQDRIDGFFMVPAQGAAAPPPEPVSTAQFEEVEHTIAVEGRTGLPATLTLPRGVESPPVVVMVHGSGPHDRDETIGPNRPFRDIAHGLARNGVASLRYDKRTKVEPQAFAGTFTVDDETVDDAVAAVELMRGAQGVDGARVFVLGHSLGAMMGPRIATRGDVDGLVLMAPPARPLQDAVVAQVGYIAALDGEIDETEKANIAALEAQRGALAALDPADPGAKGMLGLPASYWLDLAGYDPVSMAAELDVPMLVMHGGRDYQVTDAEFQRWRGALGERADVAFVQYPALNHLFIAGEGRGKPADYAVEGTVAAQVIEDIARWVHSVGSPSGGR